jgi:hypothetical protein
MTNTEHETREYFRNELGEELPGGLQVNIRCPLHEENSASFSMNLQSGLWTCHARCRHGNFLQLCERIEAQGRHRQGIHLPADTREEIESERLLEHAGRKFSVYPYCDENSTELYRVVRIDNVDGTKCFRSEAPSADGRYTSGIQDLRRVLYQLPELRAAELVLIAEGEKCVDAVRALGLSRIAGCAVTATCNYGGANKWRPDYNDCLKGKRIVILPDNDEAGRQHALSVAEQLNPFAKEVKIINLPSLPAKGDVVEFIAAHGDKASQELLTLIDSTHIWRTPDPARATPLQVMTVADLFATSAQQLDWLVDHLLLASGLSLIAAKPKTGKSTQGRNLLLKVARGEPFLGRRVKAGPVIYVCLEDSIPIVRDHFKRLGVTQSDPILFISHELTTDELRAVIAEHRPVLVVIDPFYRFARIRQVDDYVQNQQALAAVDRLCREFGVHICLVHHASKAAREDDFDSILGSTALFGGVETCILLKRDPQSDGRTVRTRSRCARDIEESLLEFDHETGHITLGQTTEAVRSVVKYDKVQALEGEILGFVLSHPSCVEDEVKEAVQGKAQSIREALARLVTSNLLAKTGDGVRGDPFRYSRKSIPIEEVALCDTLAIHCLLANRQYASQFACGQ